VRGTLTIPAGSLYAMINVGIINSTNISGTKYFYVQISNPINGAITDNSAKINILYGTMATTTMDTSAPSLSISSQRMSTDEDLVFSEQTLSVKAQPNPSSNYFNFIIRSSNNEPVTIKLIDLAGRVVETKTGVPANGTIQLGHRYGAGIYIAHIFQGKENVQLKLIKL